jgi:hypothetical protein
VVALGQSEKCAAKFEAKTMPSRILTAKAAGIYRYASAVLF